MSRCPGAVLVLAIGALLLLGGSLPLLGRAVGTEPTPDTSAVVADAGPPTSPPNPFSTGMAASAVLGSPNFTGVYSSSSLNASVIEPFPEYATTDAAGDVWVADYGADRELEFPAPLTDGEPASVVLGQANFSASDPGASAFNLSGPVASAVDAAGDVWVSDFYNNRILEYIPPFTNGMSASLVLGQDSFAGSAPGHTLANLSGPLGLAFDGRGDLWVADLDNNRVLEYRPPFVSGMNASLVLGQADGLGDAPGLSARNLSGPVDVFAGPNWIWVADAGNDRVVGYPIPARTGEAATEVLGETSLSGSGATGPAAFANPVSVYQDARGAVWVSDENDNRVVEFRPPFTDFETPSIAIGQSTLSGTGEGLSATTLTAPFGATMTPGGQLLVTDGGNGRLLEYQPTNYSVTLTAAGLPAGTPWSATVDNQTVAGAGPLAFSVVNGSYFLSVSAPAGYEAAPAYSPLEVNGSSVALTVQFGAAPPVPFPSGAAATVELGQPNFWASGSAGSLANASNFGNGSTSVAVDAEGDVWVADAGFNRVVEYRPPFVSGMNASLVLGQRSFNGSRPGLGPANLSTPEGLAFDPSGDLWVADAGANRAVEFAPPFSTGMNATVVIGQSSFAGDRPGNGATNLSAPTGLAFDGDDLWVVDSGDNRLLEFVGPLSSGEGASVVLGQSTFSGVDPGTSATNLSSPSAVAFDALGDAWVADTNNNRVVEFSAPLRTGEAATLDLGPPTLASNATAGPGGLRAPTGVAVDPTGNIWVADSGDNRVVEFPGNVSGPGNSPIGALGQSNDTTDFASLGPRGLDDPSTVGAGSQGDLWVTDAGNHRVVGYQPSTYSLTFSLVGLPSGVAWTLSLSRQSFNATSPSFGFARTNGSYAWSIAPIRGFVLTPPSGVALVRGLNVTVAVNVRAVTYAVAFQSEGLPNGTVWSVSLDGTTHTGSGDSTLVFALANGTYGYSVRGAAGYAAVNSTGVVAVVGSSQTLVVTFIPSPLSDSWVTLATLLGLTAGGLTGVGLYAYFVASRRPPVAPSPSSARARDRP